VLVESAEAGAEAGAEAVAEAGAESGAHHTNCRVVITASSRKPQKCQQSKISHGHLDQRFS